MSYKRINSQDLVVGKTYYIVPTARLITNNKKNVDSIPERLKKRFLFPEGKLETMREIPEGSSYGEVYERERGTKLYPVDCYGYWLPACSFTGLKSHGKPLLNSVKNFVCGATKVDGYTFFSTEMSPAAPDSTMVCVNCKKELILENGILKLKNA
jgi:hypothetical protein